MEWTALCAPKRLNEAKIFPNDVSSFMKKKNAAQAVKYHKKDKAKGIKKKWTLIECPEFKQCAFSNRGILL